MMSREQQPARSGSKRHGARIEREAGEPERHRVGRCGIFPVRPSQVVISAAETAGGQCHDELRHDRRRSGPDDFALDDRGK